MSYKCLDCGHIFCEGEEVYWHEDMGAYWGEPCSTKMSGCPMCKGTYEETERCQICGGEFLEEELTSGVCDECITEHINDYEFCYEINNGETTQVEIDIFLSTLFSPEEINEILKMKLEEKAKHEKIDCKDFIEMDKYWFADELAQKSR